MNNILQMNSDQVNLYITINVETKLIGKIVISGIIVSMSILIGFTLLNTDQAFDSIDTVLPVFILIILIYILPIKYFLWNFFGKEHIIINTKSISHSFDYGLIRTALRTQKIDRLALHYEAGTIKEDIEKGHLIFYNYRNEDHLPEIIYRTNAILTKEKILQIEDEIQRLYQHEFNEGFHYINFSEN